MKFSNPHPVDSTFHRCCRAIDQHAPDCAARGDAQLGTEYEVINTDLLKRMRAAAAAIHESGISAAPASANGGNDRWACAPWCVDGDGHPKESHREDQWCQGPFHTVGCSLEEAAPASHKEPTSNDPHVTAYACGRYYRLPYVVLHLYRESIKPGWEIDTEFKLTAAEAEELAGHLLAVAAEIQDGA